MTSQKSTCKKLGQFYTPDHIVDKILTDSGVFWADSHKLILDPACGDGRFLIPIVKNLLLTSPPKTIPLLLQSIHGWDIDPDAIASCRLNLDKLIEPYHLAVDWNLSVGDALEAPDKGLRFDYIIGNPPYVRVQNLSASQKKTIRSFSLCQSGSTDLYIAFFELAMRLLTESGTCTYITPNAYFKNDSGKKLRNYFVQTKCLSKITDYGSIKLFKNANVFTAITTFGRQAQRNFTYEYLKTPFQIATKSINFASLDPLKPWSLDSAPLPAAPKGIRLGEICTISAGITTLSNELYIVKVLDIAGHLAMVENGLGQRIAIEKRLIRPIIKASQLKTDRDPIAESIIFPYEADPSGKQRIIPEWKLKSELPFTYNYFCNNRSTLISRDNGKTNKVAWYAFGRSQALNTSFGKKIIFAPLNIRPNFILHHRPECTLYSGYFIKSSRPYDALLKELNSARMQEYIDLRAPKYQGGYRGYSKRILEDFIISNPDLL
ncbi:N-6 DNA methylase [Dyadobacter jejuensis]|uniref:site-specific DNA-methyltransferase (adenine-specific) n=1 Tax=Dyadobacter jejuensis TaxID=1082580 RepID=A0A316APG2_9BACT|nr:N-6 DNA methylase [Dyadobacter jejuensis]PWJ59024.1 N-6 DNA methylase [Dyadobacter jejuensis]